MIRQTFPATRETPAEFNPDSPVRCAVCHEEWDSDDEAHMYEEIGSAIYCKGSCLLKAWEEQYRREVGLLLRIAFAAMAAPMAAVAEQWEANLSGFGTQEWLDEMVEKAERFERGEEVAA